MKLPARAPQDRQSSDSQLYLTASADRVSPSGEPQCSICKAACSLLPNPLAKMACIAACQATVC